MACGCGTCPYEGQQVTKRYAATDANGDPVDAATVTVRIVKPDGTIISDTPVAHDGLGAYSFTVTASQAGQWWYKFTGTGVANTVCEGAFLVAASMVPA